MTPSVASERVRAIRAWGAEKARCAADHHTGDPDRDALHGVTSALHDAVSALADLRAIESTGHTGGPAWFAARLAHEGDLAGADDPVELLRLLLV